MDSSATKELKPQQQRNESEIENDVVNLPTTLTQLQDQPRQSNDEGVINERKKISEGTVKATSSAAALLELGCDDEGLIVVQADDKQKGIVDSSRVFKEDKQAARSK